MTTALNKIELPTRMRDGSTADDPRLARLPEFDSESRKYSVSDLVAGAQLRGRTWRTTFYLNQEQTSACTGNARTYDLGSEPVPLKDPDTNKHFTEDFAQKLYGLAKTFDEWPGEDYDGSSVLGAIKAAVSLGYIGEYRWAFDINDWLLAISTIGGSVVGTTWFNSMFDPLPTGEMIVDPKSGDAGGHSYFFRGIIVDEYTKKLRVGPKRNRHGVPLLRGRNSWGLGWGLKGEFYMWADDYHDHLWEGGEQSVVTQAFHR